LNIFLTIKIKIRTWHSQQQGGSLSYIWVSAFYSHIGNTCMTTSFH